MCMANPNDYLSRQQKKISQMLQYSSFNDWRVSSYSKYNNYLEAVFVHWILLYCVLVLCKSTIVDLSYCHYQVQLYYVECVCMLYAGFRKKHLVYYCATVVLLYYQ